MPQRSSSRNGGGCLREQGISEDFGNGEGEMLGARDLDLESGDID